MIGQTVSHYTILEKLSEGGMGLIYKARDNNLNRIVALKFLLPEITRDSRAKERFMREAQTISILDHPNICTLHHIETLEDGRMFMVMAYYEGESLKQRLERGRLRIDEAIDIAIHVCRGLQRAHEEGVIHRDIKPGNIMVTARGEVKILDFGLSKLSGKSRLTQQGIALGTAGYMSPEQAGGEELDNRTDIWSLGVVLYELITGRLPFQANSPRSTLYAIMHKPPARISDSNLQVPRQLQQIIMRCLEKKPARRFSDLESLERQLLALKTVADGEKDTVRITSGVVRPSRRRVPRRWIWVAGLAGAVAALYLAWPMVRGLFFPAQDSTGPVAGPHVVLFPLETKEGETRSRNYAAGYSAYLTERLMRLERYFPTYWIISWESVLPLEQRDFTSARRRWGIDRAIRGNLERKDRFLTLKLEGRSAQQSRWVAIAEVSKDITHLNTWQKQLPLEIGGYLGLNIDASMAKDFLAGATAVPRAFEYYVLGLAKSGKNADKQELLEAETLFQKALHLDSSYLLPRIKKVWVKYRIFQIVKNNAYLEEAVNQLEQILVHAPEFADIPLLQSLILVEKGMMESAVTGFRNAIAMHPHHVEIRLSMARLFDSLEDTSASEEAYRGLITARPYYPRGYNFMAYFFYRNSRFPEAIQMYRKILELNPASYLTCNSLGGLYFLIGDHKEAIKLFEKSLSILPNADARSNLATLYFFNGRYSRAADLLREAVKLENNNFMVWYNFADVLSRIKSSKEEAGKAYREAVGLGEEELAGSEDRKTRIWVKSCLARLHVLFGRDQRALALLGEIDADQSQRPEIFYNLLVVHELTGDRRGALDSARKYIERYGSPQYLLFDPDLHSLRADEEFKNMLE